MDQQTANHANRIVFSREEAQQLPPDIPYISHINFNDWTEGHPHMMHCHPDVLELLLIYRGRGHYAIGLHRYEVAAGDVIICNSGEVHDEFPQRGQVYQTLCLGIRQLQLPGLPPNHLLAHDRVPVFHQPRQSAELAELLLLIDRHAREERPYAKKICQQLTLAVLELTKQMIQETEILPVDSKNRLCEEVEAYIYRHYMEDITIEQLGRRFAVSPYHLAHVFKENTGYTIKQYILRRRIGEAQNRLILTQDAIVRIAKQVGFEDAGYFTRMFTKFVGMPPTEYRAYRHIQQKTGEDR